VILGHSERRKYQKETDEMINQKIRAALKNNLMPILCAENDSQIKKGLKGISEQEFEKIILAYEPVFAIGTGKPCPPEKAEEMKSSIKKTIKRDAPILYGGSVNSQNARDYIEKAGFQGLLVGGASLNPQEFINLVKNAVNT
jgi:triosephosphate isomerase